MQQPQWLPVVGFPKYSVSSNGEVKRDSSARGAKVGRILKPYLRSGDGYLSVNLYPYVAPSLVHRLVAEAFLGPPPIGSEVNHINSVRTDNRVENLEWVTRKGNVEHCIRMGRFNAGGLKGENHGMHLLMECEVRAIRASDASAKALATEYGVKAGTIREIRRRRTWRHI